MSTRGQCEPRENGASRDPYLRERATRPDYPAYVCWCLARGIRPLASEPLAYGDCPTPARFDF